MNPKQLARLAFALMLLGGLVLVATKLTNRAVGAIR